MAQPDRGAAAGAGHGCLGGLFSCTLGNGIARRDCKSSTLRALATRDDLTALSQRNFDASTFNAWFIAFTLNSPQNEAIAVRRFRVAFNAWLATDSQHNPNAPPAPTYMPQYKLPAQTKPMRSTTQPLRNSRQATRRDSSATTMSGSPYFLAAVLFLVGIGSSFKLHSIRYALVTFGSVLLILSIVLILRQPGLPS